MAAREPPVESPLLDVLSRSAEVAAAEPLPRDGVRTEASAFVWASVRRWPALHASFSLLFEVGYVDESRLITRAVAELAINAAWVVQGRATSTGLYSTRDERAKGLEEWFRHSTSKWWKAMNTHSPEMPFSEAMTKNWEEATAGATRPEGLPDLCGRAKAVEGTTFPLQVYDFSYRADSQVTHSNSWTLISHAQGKLHLMSSIAVVNAFGAAMLLLSTGADALQSEALGREVKRIRDAMGNCARLYNGRALLDCQIGQVAS